jgi:hypothetical protein
MLFLFVLASYSGKAIGVCNFFFFLILLLLNVICLFGKANE